MAETLILRYLPIGGVWYLMDARGNLIGRFNDEAEAVSWARENGYKVIKR